jgi:aminopeptidase YwaD
MLQVPCRRRRTTRLLCEKSVMSKEWQSSDRWLMGEAWVGSRIGAHVTALCDDIGVRWAGTENERRAAQYIVKQLDSISLDEATIEEFELRTADCRSASMRLVGDNTWEAEIRPCLFCPSIDIKAPLVDVGFGMRHELDALGDRLQSAVVLIRTEFEPFSDPRHLTLRLHDLARAGVTAAVTSCSHWGRRLQHMLASDWRDGDPLAVPLPLVQTSREDAAKLRRLSTGETRIAIDVKTEFRSATSWNALADLPGSDIADEFLLLGVHHDTTPDSFGANDNGAGVAVLLETARLLAGLTEELNVRPGRTIRFISFGAEEQALQGSAAFVERHYGPDAQPRMMLNLDELATGTMKGIVLQFPDLRGLVQQQLDSMNEGLECHVLSQVDASGDMYPFAQRGIPSSFLWRWRFVGRHPEAAFGHSSSDTPDKLRLRELKEYAGLLARLLLRLSHVPQAAWPDCRIDVDQIAQRIEAERGAVFRTM